MKYNEKSVRITKRSIKEENILTRLRVGHTMLNKTLKIINKHPAGLCEHCGGTSRTCYLCLTKVY